MQEAGARRLLGERTVDYGLAAMDFCGTLPRTAAGRHEAACGRTPCVSGDIFAIMHDNRRVPSANLSRSVERPWGSPL